MCSLGEVQFTPKEKAGVNTVSIRAPLDGIDCGQFRFDTLEVENLIRIFVLKFQWGKEHKENSSKSLSPLHQSFNLKIRWDDLIWKVRWRRNQRSVMMCG